MCVAVSCRMCLRSNSGLSHIFTSLSDAPTEPRLALSTTAIMFMLCQDRLNMDLDRDSLQLMVDLLEYDDGARLHNPQVCQCSGMGGCFFSLGPLFCIGGLG